MFDQVVLAQYRCRYDRQTHQVQNIHDGVFFDTPFASPQGLLIALDPQDAEVVKRPPRVKQQAIKSLLHKQSSTTRRAGGLRMPSRGGRCVKNPLKGDGPGKFLKELRTPISPSRGSFDLRWPLKEPL